MRPGAPPAVASATAPPTFGCSVGADPPTENADARTRHLFRAARRRGRIHPLQHLIQRHHEKDAARPLGQPALPLPLPPTTGSQTAATPVPRPGAELHHAATRGAPAAHDPIDAGQLRRLVRELPALPQAALEALVALRDEFTGSNRCADLIGRDQALVARTLRLANSAFYGVPGRVGSVHDAVHLLGRRTLGSLITVASVSGQFQAVRCNGFSFGGFWRHAVAAALVARSVARAVGRDEEQAFTVGLLHDIGRLTLAVHFPQPTAVAIRAVQELDGGVPAAEQAVLGTDHVEVGSLIAAQWRFPAEVVQAIAGHHAPAATADGKASLADVVHAADVIAHALDLACNAQEIVPALDLAAWHRLDLKAPAVLRIFQDTESGVAEICQALGL